MGIIPLTDNELAELKVMFDAGSSLKQASEWFGLSKYLIAQALRGVGRHVPSRPCQWPRGARKPYKWDADKNSRLKLLVKEKPAKQVAAELGTSVAAIYIQISRLKKKENATPSPPTRS